MFPTRVEPSNSNSNLNRRKCAHKYKQKQNKTQRTLKLRTIIVTLFCILQPVIYGTIFFHALPILCSSRHTTAKPAFNDEESLIVTRDTTLPWNPINVLHSTTPTSKYTELVQTNISISTMSLRAIRAPPAAYLIYQPYHLQPHIRMCIYTELSFESPKKILLHYMQ